MTPKLDAFSIVVSDMARSIGFYRKLGLDFPEGAENEAHAEAPLGAGIRLMLDTEEVIVGLDPQWKRSEHTHGGAFQCESPAEVDAVYEELLAAGATSYKEPWDAFWGQRYAQLRDPDGTIFDLYVPLP